MFKLMSIYSHRKNTARKKGGPPSEPYFKTTVYTHVMGRNSAVGIVTRYGIYGPGVESRCGRGFPLPSRPALGPTQPPLRCVLGHSRRYKGRGVALTTHPHLSPRLKKEKRIPLFWVFVVRPKIELYLYYHLSFTFTFTFTFIFTFTFTFTYTHVQLFKTNVHGVRITRNI